MISVKRYENETEEHLIYRVCQMKDSTNTWNEISDVLNKILGYNYTESRYRKIFQAYNKIKNGLKDVALEEQIEELELLKEEIELEKKKISTLNIEKNRYDRQKARHILFYEQISEYIQQLPIPKFEKINIKQNKKKYLLTLADIHMGACFVIETNEYSPKIVKDRFEILLNETIKFIKEKQLDEITVVGLADYVQGTIHTNDLRINDSTVVKSVVDIARIISIFLNELSSFCKVYYYGSTYGNHQQMRYLGSKPNEMMNEDIGYVIENYIKDSLRQNNRITIILPKEDDLFLEITNIFDFNIIACHGHQLKNIDSALADISMRRRKFFDYLITGHWHSKQEISCGDAYAIDTEVLVAPSICGSDTYSESLFKGSKSASCIYGFDEVYGHTETYKIILN